MRKIKIVNLDNKTQLSLFFLLINNPSGLQRKEIVRRLCIPRSTVFDNLDKMKKRQIVDKYFVYTQKKGRPMVIWFTPKYLRQELINVDLKDKIVVKGMSL